MSSSSPPCLACIDLERADIGTECEAKGLSGWGGAEGLTKRHLSTREGRKGKIRPKMRKLLNCTADRNYLLALFASNSKKKGASGYLAHSRKIGCSMAR